MKLQYLLFSLVLMIMIESSTPTTRNFKPMDEVPLAFEESSVLQSKYPNESNIFNDQMLTPKQTPKQAPTTRNFKPIDKQNVFTWNNNAVVPLASQESTVLRIKHPKESNLFDDQILTPKQYIKRRKRSVTACSNLTSCAGRCSRKRMFHNIKENKHEPACYCDPECDKIFTDCCADYVKNCGTPKIISPKKLLQKWKCFAVKKFPFKIWMIAGCKPDWPRNASSVKNCAKFSERNAKASWVTPVLAGRTTYRNRYCAWCNAVKSFKYWKIKKIECKIDAPKKYTTVKKLRHYDKYCAGSLVTFKQSRGLRYCYNIVKTCRYFHDRGASIACKLGMTGVVSSRVHSAYRNRGCVLCNTKENDEPVNITCGPRLFEHPIRKDFESRVELTTIITRYSSRHPGSITTNNYKCLASQFYDNAAKLCRNIFVYNATTSNNFLRQLAVRLLYEQTTTNSCSTEQIRNRNTSSYIRQNFLAFLRKKFDLYLAENSSTQWRFHDLDVHMNHNNSKSLVTFQILRAWSVNETIENSFFMDDLKIGEIEIIFVYGGNISACSYVLTKVETREAACLDNQTYPVNMEDLESSNGSIYINITKTEYRSGQYLVYQHQNETRIALCQDSKPAQCLYHVPVQNRTHWKEFANRSIYSFVTKSWFHYGEYSLVNGTLWLCLTKDYNRQTHRALTKSRSIHRTILGYGTTVSLSVSILSLILLLLVYSMFAALRNIPGKNLMLFSAILALAQTAWLLQAEISSLGTGMCPTINVVMQYLFLASFSCSLSIAIQSFLTFNALAKGKLRRRSKGGSFLKYAMIGLGLPCLFVVVCIILDTNDLVAFDYGTSDGHCWFSTTNVLYIGFLYPGFVLLLGNMSLFFATLRVIYKCTKASQRLAENTGGANKKHVGIYIRMSTIMGFTWLCAVLNIFFPGEVAFQYIFVFVNGFQGLYLSFAFLSTENVRKIVFGKSGKGLNTTTSQESVALRVL